jgi:hypothetical protein
MAGDLRGDYGGLEAVFHTLQSFPGMLDELALEGSIEIFEAIDSLFTLGSDPYGKPWAQLAPATLAKGRAMPPLTDTGRMRESLRVNVGVRSIVATVDDPAGYHQEGTRYMPARPILPNDAQGLPDAWRAALSEAAQRILAAKERR